ncbi:hypothetical protein [Pontibacter sp. G13]|uniref:hypothetical protein n=1 Tax=Pontibacter sp. G13 TaxID=3074898 RepID=UPI00288C2430|nr:hypothetical protein [Pontibacter sp. G13]WNJ18092.1 hypothetical protein RJD25_24820 [Pontibacter sp. G13]
MNLRMLEFKAAFWVLALLFLALPSFAQLSPIPGACGIVGPNQIVNPEFNLGNTNISSDYQFNAGYVCAFGQYTVSSSVVFDPGVVCYSFPGFNLQSIWAVSDRETPGTGNFMIIDPAVANGTTDDYWAQSIPVCPNTDYVFSMYAKNLYFLEAPNYSGVNPEFELEINGGPITGYYVDGVLSGLYDLDRDPQADSMQWVQISGTWNSGTDSVANLAIRNIVTDSLGNDLAIDGIYFGLCGETVAMNVSGAVEQCGETGFNVFSLSPTLETVNSNWKYFEWYKEDSLLQASASPDTLTVFPVNDGSHLGNYSLRVYRDSLGAGCDFSSSTLNVYEDCSRVFPVSWLDFQAMAIGSSVWLGWSTGMEAHNQGFDVQMARDGGKFFSMGFVPSQGDAQHVQAYEFQTGDLPSGVYQFRLRQVDLDGSASFSVLQEVIIQMESEYSLLLSPNPADVETMLYLEVAEAQTLSLELIGVDGRRVKSLGTHDFQSGSQHQIRIPTQDLASGNYLLSIQGDNFAASTWLKKQ